MQGFRKENTAQLCCSGYFSFRHIVPCRLLRAALPLHHEKGKTGERINSEKGEQEKRKIGKRKSNNYRKLSVRLSNAQRKVANIRRDFTQKVTTILTTHYAHIALEDLNVKGMVRNHRLAQSVSDVAFGELCRQIEYKSMLNGIKVLKADRFYPSRGITNILYKSNSKVIFSQKYT